MTPENRGWFILVLIIGLGWMIYVLAPVITPFAVSAGLAYLGDPLVDRLERLSLFGLKCSRSLAVVLVFLLISLVLGVLLLIFLPLLWDQLERLIEKFPEMFEWLAGTALPWLQQRFGFTLDMPDSESIALALKTYWKETSTAVLSVAGTVSRGGQAVMHWLMNLILIPVVTFYLLRDWDRLVEGIRTLIPRRAEATASSLAAEIDEVLGAFIRGQLMVMVALGVIYSVGLWLIGLDLALIIGMIAGLLSIVPYLGTFVGVAAALVASAFQFQDLLHPVLVLLVFVAGQSLEGMVLTPKLVGDRVGLHPVAVIFAVLAGGQLFGFVGILLALPATAALNVLVRYLHRKYQQSGVYVDSSDLPGSD